MPQHDPHRIAHRGAHSRFEAESETSRREADLYRDTITRLADHGYPVLSLDTTHTPPDQAVTLLTSRIAQLAALPPPQ